MILETLTEQIIFVLDYFSGHYKSVYIIFKTMAIFKTTASILMHKKT